jgi:hypothetical protein
MRKLKKYIKYKEAIKNVVKHVCYFCQRLYFKYHVFVASKPYIEKFLDGLKMKKL